MASILDTILPQLEFWGYWIVLLVTLLENSAFVGLVIPGDVTLLVAGFLASEGILSLPALIAIATVGAILGDSAGYAIGRFGGLKFLERYGRYILFKPKHLETAQKYFRIHGGKTILVGRFVMVIKSLGPVAAGIGRMPYGTFLFYNVIGSVLNVSAVLLLGYFFGQSWQLIGKWLGLGGAIAFSLVVAAAIGWWLVRYWRRKKAIRS